MKLVQCQGRSFVTTEDVANAIVNFSVAATRRGRVVTIDVPIVADVDAVVKLILSPGEKVVVGDSAVPEQDLDTAPLIRSLADRSRAWQPRNSSDT